MNNSHAWLEELYHSHITYLTYYAQKKANGNRQILQEIPDIIQRVFVLLYEKRTILMRHPNIGGWLTITTRTIVSDMMRDIGKMRDRGMCSIDEDNTKANWEAEEAKRAAALNASIQKISDQLSRIEDQIGNKNLEILTRYYDPDVNNAELARSLQMSEVALRQKVNRLCRKLQKNMFVILIICFTSQMTCL